MKLSVMREYMHLCNTKNYTKTAEELYIDQSALSRHIAALEKEMGAQLILRSKNLFQLTEAGEKIPLSNYDEVPYLLEDTGAIYISPMANSNAYGEAVETRYIEPERLSQNIGVVWLKKNKNDAIQYLCNAVKICYP